jgi:hypothetical protein
MMMPSQIVNSRRMGVGGADSAAQRWGAPPPIFLRWPGPLIHHPPPTAFQSSITRFTGRFSAFRLAAKANSRTSPRNVEVQSPVSQSENRQPQNRMRGNLYAKSLLVSGGIRLTGSALTT